MTSALSTYLFAFEIGPAVIQSVPVVIVALDDPSGKILYTTPLTCALFGYGENELHNKCINNLIPGWVKYDDYAANPKTRSMNEGMVVDARRKDESTFFVQVSLTIRWINKIQYIIACLADATQAMHHNHPDPMPH